MTPADSETQTVIVYLPAKGLVEVALAALEAIEAAEEVATEEVAAEEVPAEETNCSYAYIVTECNTEVEAKERYPEACIKGIERVPTRITTSTQVNADGNTVDISQFSNTYISDLPKAFAEMIKESGITVSRSTYSLVNSVIS